MLCAVHTNLGVILIEKLVHFAVWNVFTAKSLFAIVLLVRVTSILAIFSIVLEFIAKFALLALPIVIILADFTIFDTIFTLISPIAQYLINIAYPCTVFGLRIPLVLKVGAPFVAISIVLIETFIAVIAFSLVLAFFAAIRAILAARILIIPVLSFLALNFITLLCSHIINSLRIRAFFPTFVIFKVVIELAGIASRAILA